MSLRSVKRSSWCVDGEIETKGPGGTIKNKKDKAS